MVSSIITALYLLNALIALVAILIKPRDVAAIWAWLLVLFALPGVGFVLYLFFVLLYSFVCSLVYLNLFFAHVHSFD